ASKQMGSWPATLTPRIEGSVSTVELGTGTGVVSLSAADFKKGTTLVLKGAPQNHLVINIRGDRVVLDGLNVILEGGLRPSRIRWNFVDAASLFIVRTHDPVLGIPGILMAPFADAQFYEGLITGSLWVRNLLYDPNCGFKRSGQINKYREPSPTCEFCPAAQGL
ncbi:MAG TPA: choice-of-anchor A family protein, partial [Pseudobdellovibrionaceae bacterium]|nr:choice-of-anchor A family protein [Pseudobdellovibrionaceae bacterium]